MSWPHLNFRGKKNGLLNLEWNGKHGLSIIIMDIKHQVFFIKKSKEYMFYNFFKNIIGRKFQKNGKLKNYSV
jgi:hypothetical protein